MRWMLNCLGGVLLAANMNAQQPDFYKTVYFDDMDRHAVEPAGVVDGYVMNGRFHTVLKFNDDARCLEIRNIVGGDVENTGVGICLARQDNKTRFFGVYESHEGKLRGIEIDKELRELAGNLCVVVINAMDHLESVRPENGEIRRRAIDRVNQAVYPDEEAFLSLLENEGKVQHFKVNP